MPDWLLMWTLAFVIFLAFKWATWLSARNSVPHKAWRSLAYLAAWPGMDARSFLDPSAGVTPARKEWVWAAFKTLLGTFLFWIVARRVPSDRPLLQGWVGLLGLILIMHFGTFQLISLLWRQLGVNAQPIMARPMLAKNLSEFWGKRWNLGFRQLAHDLIFRPLRKRIGVVPAGFLVFVISGLLHDLVISIPAHGGYGLPTGYFVLQGLGVSLEHSEIGQRAGLHKRISGWLFMFFVVAGPAFWLFHPPFVRRVILPFMHAVRAL